MTQQFLLKDEECYVEQRDASPSNLLLKIQSFSLLSQNGVSKYDCREFEAGGYKWKVTICLNRGGNVGAWLSVGETSSLPVDWEVHAIFAFFLYDHIANTYVGFRGTTRRFNALFPKWGFPKMIPYKSLIDTNNGYVVDDNCVFGAEVFVIKSQRINECLSLLKADTASLKCEWKLSHFSKLNSVWYSEEFSVGDHKWKVKLYPKGKTAQVKNRYVSMYIEYVDSKSFDSHQKVKADVTLRMKSKIHDTHHSRNYNHWFSSSSHTWGFTEFLPIGDMSSRDFLVDDCCFPEIEISVQALALDAPKIEH